MGASRPGLPVFGRHSRWKGNRRFRYSLPMDLEGMLRVLRACPVEFAYLFGSAARGRQGPLSDTDLAVYLSPALAPARRRDLRLRLYRDLAPMAPSGLDVVVLNDAALNLAFGVLESGRPILRRNERRRVLFEAGVRSRYFDRLYYIRRSAAQVVERAARRGVTRPW